jgi:riboflavin kinase/FMN adenylyltransferase
MRIVRDAVRSAELPRGAVVTIGNYDGVHRGQRAVLGAVVRAARERGVFSALVTFDPHPLELLAPERAPLRISSEAQRQRLLSDQGLDELWRVPFTAEFSRLSAAEFARRVLVAGLGAREVHVGSRFVFGHERQGNLARLEELGREHGFDAVGHPEVRHAGEPISSTRIRDAVASGDVDLAAELLGRPFAVEGRVVRGDRVGHELGWPTANVTPESERNLLPADGVYVTSATVEREAAPLPGVTNVGVRPTRDGAGGRRVECHLFDFDRELYGEKVEVSFLQRLRGERRFPSLAALRDQIAADAALGREYFRGGARSPERGSVGISEGSEANPTAP